MVTRFFLYVCAVLLLGPTIASAQCFAVINTATKEVKSVARFNITLPGANLKTVAGVPCQVAEDYEIWRANADNTGVIKLSQAEIDAVTARRQARAARLAAAKSALAQYAAVIKRAQDYNQVLAWAQSNFPSLTPAEQANIARVVHMSALTARGLFQRDDTFFNSGE